MFKRQIENGNYSYGIIQSIAEQIDDSLTWCRFSQISKKINLFLKTLIMPCIETKLDGVWSRKLQFNRLPSGVLHGPYHLEIKASSFIIQYADDNGNTSGPMTWSSRTEKGYHKDGFMMPQEMNEFDLFKPIAATSGLVCKPLDK